MKDGKYRRRNLMYMKRDTNKNCRRVGVQKELQEKFSVYKRKRNKFLNFKILQEDNNTGLTSVHDNLMFEDNNKQQILFRLYFGI